MPGGETQGEMGVTHWYPGGSTAESRWRGDRAGCRVGGLPCSVTDTLDLGQPGWAPAAREVMFRLLRGPDPCLGCLRLWEKAQPPAALGLSKTTSKGLFLGWEDGWNGNPSPHQSREAPPHTPRTPSLTVLFWALAVAC